MSHILTIVGPKGALSDHLIAQVAQKAGGTEPRWLASEEACALRCKAAPSQDTLGQLRSMLNGPFDLFVTAATSQRKKLLIADMDSTILEGETLDDIAALAGIGSEIHAITERAMRGELDFATALNERVALLKDQPASFLEEVEGHLNLSPGAKMLVQTMKAEGAHCILVSGGFTFFTSRIAQQLGFDAHHGNRIEIADGKLTGKVLPPILGRAEKRTILFETCQKLGLTPEDALAIGDGANDLDMLSAAGLAIGYRPKPLLKERLTNIIAHHDLRAALFAQGYHESEMKAAMETPHKIR